MNIQNRVPIFRDASFWIGLFCALSIITPFYGPVFGMPAISIAPVFLGASLFLLLAFRRSKAIRIAPLGPFLAGLLLLALVAIAATGAQWDFLLSPSNWASRETDYTSAKLLMILVSLIPALGASLIVVSAKGKDGVVTGAMAGIVLVASAAAVRVLLFHGHQIIRTDYQTVFEFMSAPMGFSLVSYGFLFTIAAIAAAGFRRGWPLSAIFLMLLALLSRRADFAVAAVFLLASCIIFYVKGEKRRGLGAGLALLAGLILAIVLHNEHNIQYMAAIGDDLAFRLELAEQSMSMKPSVGDVLAFSDQQTFLFGRGLASYAEIYPIRYPHNIVLEAFYEFGLAGVFVVLTSYAFSAFAFASVMWRPVSAWSLVTALSALSFGLLSLKAGDLTSAGGIIFAASLAMVAWQSAGQSQNNH